MISARAALERLREGNARFAADVSRRVTTRRKRRQLAAGQEPLAIVLGCSDSSVPAELVFDPLIHQPLLGLDAEVPLRQQVWDEQPTGP